MQQTLLLVVFICLFLAWIAGIGSAANQRVFYEEYHTNYVLVGVDGNNLILEQRVGKQLTGTLALVPIDGRRQVELRPIPVGPLRQPRECVYQTC